MSDRLSNIEGQMKAFATKEDVANAKLNLTLAWMGARFLARSPA